MIKFLWMCALTMKKGGWKEGTGETSQCLHSKRSCCSLSLEPLSSLSLVQINLEEHSREGKETLLSAFPVSLLRPKHPSSASGILLNLLTPETPRATPLKPPQPFCPVRSVLWALTPSGRCRKSLFSLTVFQHAQPLHLLQKGRESSTRPEGCCNLKHRAGGCKSQWLLSYNIVYSHRLDFCTGLSCGFSAARHVIKLKCVSSLIKLDKITHVLTACVSSLQNQQGNEAIHGPLPPFSCIKFGEGRRF